MYRTHHTRYVLLAAVMVGLIACTIVISRTNVSSDKSISFWQRIRFEIDWRRTQAMQAGLKREDQRLTVLEADADLFVEVYSSERIHRLRPANAGDSPFTLSGTQALASLVPPATECGRHLAVLRIPPMWLCDPDNKSVPEVVVELAEHLKAQGFRRIVVDAMAERCMRYEVYADGLPSRQELQKMKAEWKGARD